MAKIKIGDVFEFETAKGMAYLQYSYLEDGIEMIRVLPGMFSKRPKNLDGLVNEKEQFLVKFPLAAAHRKGMINLVGSFFLPKDIVKPQYMRETHIVRGIFLGWHIINTDTLQRQLVENLTDAQKRLSPYGIWNDTLLRERLEIGWTLYDW